MYIAVIPLTTGGRNWKLSYLFMRSLIQTPGSYATHMHISNTLCFVFRTSRTKFSERSFIWKSYVLTCLTAVTNRYITMDTMYLTCTHKLTCRLFVIYTVAQNKTCDCNNLYKGRPSTVIFGTLITQTISCWTLVSLPTSLILCDCFNLGNCQTLLSLIAKPFIFQLVHRVLKKVPLYFRL